MRLFQQMICMEELIDYLQRYLKNLVLNFILLEWKMLLILKDYINENTKLNLGRNTNQPNDEYY